jgi:hypothetical protein
MDKNIRREDRAGIELSSFSNYNPSMRNAHIFARQSAVPGGSNPCVVVVEPVKAFQ